MAIEHVLDTARFRNRPVDILIVGSGGTGGAVVMALPYLHQAMRAWGRREGLRVSLMDGDAVSQTNCVRQPFSEADIGHNKATVLINRLNLFWGLHWSAIPTHFNRQSLRSSGSRTDFVISCVDTRKARSEIEAAVRSNSVAYWLDLGNNAASGQYVLGQPLNHANRSAAERLRTVSELYPEVSDLDAGEDDLPSCSAVESLDRQEPYINQVLANSALAMLARLFRYGRLSHHGAFYNAATGRMSALLVDPSLWRRIRRRSKSKQPARRS